MPDLTLLDSLFKAALALSGCIEPIWVLNLKRVDVVVDKVG